MSRSLLSCQQEVPCDYVTAGCTSARHDLPGKSAVPFRAPSARRSSSRRRTTCRASACRTRSPSGRDRTAPPEPAVRGKSQRRQSRDGNRGSQQAVPPVGCVHNPTKRVDFKYFTYVRRLQLGPSPRCTVEHNQKMNEAHSSPQQTIRGPLIIRWVYPHQGGVTSRDDPEIERGSPVPHHYHEFTVPS